MIDFSLHRAKIILTCAAVIFVVGALIYFVMIPLNRQLAGSQEEILRKRQELVNIDQEIINYKTAIAELSKVKADQDSVNLLFPEREEMVFLVAALEDSVSAAGMTPELKITDKKEEQLASGSKSKTKEKTAPIIKGLNRVEEVPYTLRVSGDYRQMTDFFRYFANLPFLSEITMASVKADSIQNDISKTLINIGTASIQLQGIFFISSE
ncbi:MAG: hypothetical protein A3B25_03645 [Candidatus Ryanbacteria bacterium RIFCSPLOWO2_01_FULL_48_26]|uniref:Pilus assembly protein PilO n=1 Tax=Candidatus Ryanbacteria bacterium RIFCSPLOWO2_01_FULL_48_26 TaxID=1802126 RepID=A0A1G2GTA9_9BACT|nr:MAG: hypothetical protein A3B25_03645 [Candidatus Ryanbacteria bacterium RIFCSPLOWO2_01_FULL_48_26]